MKILKINSSSNTYNSVTRAHVNTIVNKLTTSNDSTVTNRDVAYSNLPFLNQDMLAAFFSREELTAEQQEAIKVSNELVEELFESDVIVIGAPMYNFSVPASLKAYFDLIARVGKTFHYTATGPEGLVTDKKVYVVISTGGTPVGSPYDFSKGYIQTFLGFLGITDIEFLTFDDSKADEEAKLAQAEEFVVGV